MREINTSTELFSELRDANQRVTKWFKEIPAENFFTRQGEIWSASDNVDHLIKSHRPNPLIGKLTIREMLFFTIYHNLRHASREGD